VSGIRTVIVTTPAMLRDLIKQLAGGRVDLEIVAEYRGRRGLPARLGKMRPDLVIIGLRRGEDDSVIRELLAMVPTAKFIVFFADGRTARGFELRLYDTDLASARPAELVEFIRRCATSFHPRRRSAV
jgi:DNA-binding NarL/FixJ family response regulator